MKRSPFKTCPTPYPKSNTQAFPGNLFRSRLGVGMSPEVKKSPQFRFVPGVGLTQIQCCFINIPTIDGGNPFATGPLIFDGGSPSIVGEIIDGGNS